MELMLRWSERHHHSVKSKYKSAYGFEDLVQFLKYLTFSHNNNKYFNDLLSILKSEDENEKE